MDDIHCLVFSQCISSRQCLMKRLAHLAFGGLAFHRSCLALGVLTSDIHVVFDLSRVSVCRDS